MTCILIKLLPEERQNKNFCDIKKKITSRPAHVRNVKRSPLGRRKILPYGNLDRHKGIKNTRNGKYVENYKRLLSLYFEISLKKDYLKANITIYCVCVLWGEGVTT